MTEIQAPKGWRKVNDVCIGVPAAKGYTYTVYHVGPRGEWTWEACGNGELLALGLPSMDEAIKVCRDDFKARRGGG